MAIAVVSWTPFVPPLRWIRDDDAIAGGTQVLDAFGIGEVERSMLPRERWVELVMERVALADVLKA